MDPHREPDKRPGEGGRECLWTEGGHRADPGQRRGHGAVAPLGRVCDDGFCDAERDASNGAPLDVLGRRGGDAREAMGASVRELRQTRARPGPDVLPALWECLPVSSFYLGGQCHRSTAGASQQAVAAAARLQILDSQTREGEGESVGRGFVAARGPTPDGNLAAEDEKADQNAGQYVRSRHHGDLGGGGNQKYGSKRYTVWVWEKESQFSAWKGETREEKEEKLDGGSFGGVGELSRCETRP